MPLQRRAQLNALGMPEAIGIALIVITFASAFLALAAFHRPATERVATAVRTPLTEEGLRRVLRDLDLRFHYDERDATEDAAIIDGPISAPAIRIAQGNGEITLALRESDDPSLVHAAGVGAIRPPQRSALETWTATAAIAYVLTLYYFTTAYPAWRRRDLA